jgi:Mn2+/Fe2+ NRAMP family transporter
MQMDWIPIVLVIFKLLVLCTGMFYAIKWHYDQGKKGRKREARAVLRAGAKMAAIFVVALLGLGLLTFVVVSMLGMDLTFP